MQKFFKSSVLFSVSGYEHFAVNYVTEMPSFHDVPRLGFRAHVCYHCRISPPRFLAECRKRRLNQGSFVLLFFRLFALSDMYLVFACLFSCTALFVSISQVTGCEDRLQNDLLCVGWGVKLYSLTHS